MTTLMELARSGALSNLTQPTTASQLLPDRFAPNSLYGSALTIPYRTGWNSSAGWTPEELNQITSQNQTAANYVNAAGGPQGFINQTGGGTMAPSQWGIQLPASSSPTNYYNAIGSAQYNAAQQSAAQQAAAAQQNVIAPTSSNKSFGTAPSTQTMNANVINPDLGNLDGTRGGTQVNTTRSASNAFPTGGRGFTDVQSNRIQTPVAGSRLNTGTQDGTRVQTPTNQAGLPYNPVIQQGQTPNPFINKSGGFNFNAASGLYNNLNSYLNPAMQQALAQSSAGNTAMGNYLYGNFPSELDNFIRTMIQQVGPSQQAQGTQMQNQFANLLSQLSSGQGLPQTGIQKTTNDFLTTALTNGGLTPEYVAAMERLVLEPQQERTMGDLNQLAGGVASLGSPALQELKRRQDQAFYDTLLTTGAQNLPTYSGQGLQAGAQNFGQGATVAGMYGTGSQNAFGNMFNAASDALTQFSTMLGGALGFNENQGQFASQLANISANMSGDVLRGYLSEMAIKAGLDQDQASAWGGVIAGLLDWIKTMGGGGGSTNPNTGGGGGGTNPPVVVPPTTTNPSTGPTFPPSIPPTTTPPATTPPTTETPGEGGTLPEGQVEVGISFPGMDVNPYNPDTDPYNWLGWEMYKTGPNLPGWSWPNNQYGGTHDWGETP